MAKAVRVEVGDQVFAAEDKPAFGAVRQVRPHELLIDVEGFGDTTIPASAVRAVHDEKVVIDVGRLPADLQAAIQRAHDREDRD